MNTAKIDYATNTAYVNYDEFLNIIKQLDPKKKSMHNYVDSATGKLLWGEGEPYSRIKLIKKPKEKSLTQKEKKLDFNTAYDALDKAVEKFLSELDMSLFDDEENIGQTIIFDLADSFFWQNPDWEKWSLVLNMSKKDMQLYVAEMIQEKL